VVCRECATALPALPTVGKLHVTPCAVCIQYAVEDAAEPVEVVHGKTCPKIDHACRIVLDHGADDDSLVVTPNGYRYCRRCHERLPDQSGA